MRIGNLHGLMLGLLAGLAGSMLPSCRGDFDGCKPGTQDCECLDQDCDAGLVCMASVCVPQASTGDGGTSGDAGDGTSPTSPGDTESSGPSSGSSDDTQGSSTATSTDGASSSGTTTTTASGTGASGTTGPVCGNGVLEAGEECDGINGCTNCELDNWDCQPLNNEPCANGLKCTYREPTPGDPSFSCVPFMEPPPGQLHEGNCYNFEPRDEWCDIGLACVVTNQANACMDTGVNCCVEYCDVLDPMFSCAHPDDVCRSFWAGSPPEGLGNLGFCIVP